jgi:hypothetical protein
MGTTHRFIADPAEPSEVLEWFRSLGQAATETPSNRGVVFSFPAHGSFSYRPDGSIDPRASPVVTVFLPRVRRGQLWTVGEVHFLPTPLRQQFPGLHKVNSSFGTWLSQLECVYSNKRQNNQFGYYLEGSVKNYDPPVFAFEFGLRALQDGRYFVADDDSEARLDSLCQALRLRGVECAAA